MRMEALWSSLRAGWIRLCACIGLLCRDRRGVAAAMTAVFGTALLGFGGLATDVSLWEGAKRSVQGAADQAVLAAAIVTPCPSTNSSCYVTAAQAVAAQQGFVNGVKGVAVNVYYPMSNDPNNCPADPNCASANAIEVVIRAPQSLIFSSLFLSSATVAAHSVANNNLYPTCMLALDSNTTDNHSIFVNSGATVALNNCSISDMTPKNTTGPMAGNPSYNSIDVKGMGSVGTLEASSIIVARDGICDPPMNYSQSGTGNCPNAACNVGKCDGDMIINGQSFDDDSPGNSPDVFTDRTITNPYASLTLPTPQSPCPTPASTQPTGASGLAANNQGGTNVTITASLTLNPGTYCSTGGAAALTITGSSGGATVTISQNVTGMGVKSGDAIEFFTGTTLSLTGTMGMNQLQFASTTGVTVGMTVSDITTSGGIPSGTTVTAKTATTVTLSNNFTGGPMGVKNMDVIAFMTGSATTLYTSAATTSGTTLTFSSVTGVSVGMTALDTTMMDTNAIPAGTTVTAVPPPRR